MSPDDAAPAADPNDPNAMLTKLLQEQLKVQAAQEAQAPKDGQPPAEPLFFGMTMAAIFVGFAISTIGFGLANYGRTQRNIVYAVSGVLMMTVPFFLTSTWALLLAATVLIAIPVAMKKLQMI